MQTGNQAPILITPPLHLVDFLNFITTTTNQHARWETNDGSWERRVLIYILLLTDIIIQLDLLSYLTIEEKGVAYPTCLCRHFAALSEGTLIL
jgi:hypothetical protein